MAARLQRLDQVGGPRGEKPAPPLRSQPASPARRAAIRSAWHVATRLTLSIALAGAAACAAATSFGGVVTHVSDGDTLWVRPDGGRNKSLKVRVLGIDAPESCQRWGVQASAALRVRVLHRRVTVTTPGHDRHGRTLGAVHGAGGEDIGAWMVAQGHAWSDPDGRSGGRYTAQEHQARSARRGLFADPGALPPRRFRERHGPCTPAAVAQLFSSAFAISTSSRSIASIGTQAAASS